MKFSNEERQHLCSYNANVGNEEACDQLKKEINGGNAFVQNCDGESF
jgi:hypothetical protein